MIGTILIREVSDFKVSVIKDFQHCTSVMCVCMTLCGCVCFICVSCCHGCIAVGVHL